MSDNNNHTDALLRSLIWALVCVVAAMSVSLACIVVGLSILPPAEGDKIIIALIDRRAVGRGVTLLLVVPSIVMLAITGRVTGEAAVAALSAIAGYMLAASGNQ